MILKTGDVFRRFRVLGKAGQGGMGSCIGLTTRKSRRALPDDVGLQTQQDDLRMPLGEGWR